MEYIEKLIAVKETLLPSIVEKIKLTRADKVILFIEEGSDIASSIVSLKLIKEKAGGLNKSLIIVTPDATCQALADKAGIVCRKQEKDIVEQDWTKADYTFTKVTQSIQSTDKELTNENDKSFDTNKIDTENLNFDVESAFNTVVSSKDNVDTSSNMDLSTVDLSSQKVASIKQNVVTDGNFSMVVGDDIIDKKITPNLPKEIIHQVPEKKQSNNFLLNKDWNLKMPSNERTVSSLDNNSDQAYIKRGGIKNQFKSIATNDSFFKNLLKNKLLLGGIIIGIIIGAFWFAWYYMFVPTVEIKLHPKNISVSFQGDITAMDNAVGVNVDNKVISSKIEFQKNFTLSAGGEVTSVTETGNPANGRITVYNSTDQDITIPVNHVVYSGQLKYVTTEQKVVPKRPDQIGKGYIDIGVKSNGFGPEYNLDAGSVFLVDGYTADQLSGINSVKFSGGTKKQTTAVTEEDVKRIGEELEKQIKDQLKQRFKDLHEHDEWTLVEDSIKFEKKGEDISRFKTDVPIGSEASYINVTAELSATALYYNKNEMESLVNELLIKDYEVQKQEGHVGDILNATLDKNVSLTYKVSSFDDKSIVLSIEASGFMKTKIQANKIKSDLKGKNWEEGMKYLNNLPYMESAPEVKYLPSNYIEELKHFPEYEKNIKIIE